MASIVKSFAISGVEAYLVDVETKTIEGQPMISIVGLGDTAVKEARERVEAALRDGKFCFPEMKIVINLAPSDLKKSGSHFDLPIALGLLLETNQLKIKRWKDYGCIGELSLNARLRRCTGVLPMVIAAKKAGMTNIIVPKENIHEASLVKGINVVGFNSLREVVEFLQGDREYNIQQEVNFAPLEEDLYPVDFKEVQGQEAMIEHIVVAAAGGHNLLMIGAPGCGKSMIAKRIPTILPSMEDQQVTISRVRYSNTYPASFMLVAAMNPCPCGYYGNIKCRCTDYEVLKYRQRLSGPILDRMDIQKYVQPVNFINLSSNSSGKTSQELRERVEFARNIQKKRFEKMEGINCNAQMGHALIKEFCQIEENGQRLLQLAHDRFQYSARTFHKYLKVSRTFADMEGSDKIRKKDVASALMSRDLEKERAGMMVL